MKKIPEQNLVLLIRVKTMPCAIPKENNTFATVPKVSTESNARKETRVTLVPACMAEIAIQRETCISANAKEVIGAKNVRLGTRVIQIRVSIRLNATRRVTNFFATVKLDGQD